MKEMNEVEIPLNTLPDTPVLPPRKHLMDYLPLWLAEKVRGRFGFPVATKLEVWLIKSIFLRVWARSLNDLRHETMQTFYNSTPRPEDLN